MRRNPDSTSFRIGPLRFGWFHRQYRPTDRPFSRWGICHPRHRVICRRVRIGAFFFILYQTKPRKPDPRYSILIPHKREWDYGPGIDV